MPNVLTKNSEKSKNFLNVNNAFEVIEKEKCILFSFKSYRISEMLNDWALLPLMLFYLNPYKLVKMRIQNFGDCLSTGYVRIKFPNCSAPVISSTCKLFL